MEIFCSVAYLFFCLFSCLVGCTYKRVAHTLMQEIFFTPWVLTFLPEWENFPSSLFTSWFMSKLTESFGGIRVKFETNIFNARVVIKQLKEQIKKICTERSDWLRDWFYYFSRRWVVMAVNLLIIISEAPSSINSKGTARCKNLPAIRSNKRQQMCKERIELNNPTLAGYGISHFYLGGGGVPITAILWDLGEREGEVLSLFFFFFLFPLTKPVLLTIQLCG